MTTRLPEAAIVPATERDIPVVLQLVRQLAEHVGQAGKVSATEQDLRMSLFGARPMAEVVLAYAGTEPIGFAAFFPTYSTFAGRAALYLEDLFVVPAWRNLGYGRQLLAHVAAVAVQRGCDRMEWSALNGNRPAIRFYERLGARPQDQSTIYRLAGDALRRLGTDATRAD